MTSTTIVFSVILYTCWISCGAFLRQVINQDTQTVSTISFWIISLPLPRAKSTLDGGTRGMVIILLMPNGSKLLPGFILHPKKLCHASRNKFFIHFEKLYYSVVGTALVLNVIFLRL
jgi:hypothetical protein